MKQYLELIDDILKNGQQREDRTGVGTLSLFGKQVRFNLEEGFPLVTTKRMPIKSIIHELLFFLSGSCNIQYLKDNNVKIWDPWADENNSIGKLYGYQWRSWNGNIDQIKEVINSIKLNPYSRRHIVSAWNVGQLDEMVLHPCHMMFQFYVSNGKLSCLLYMRSADIGIGVPFNIASYSLLTMMIAQLCGLKAYEFILTIGDAHIYLNHIEKLEEQLKRECYKLPEMLINKNVNDIDGFRIDDFELVDYKYHSSIKLEVAV